MIVIFIKSLRIAKKNPTEVSDVITFWNQYHIITHYNFISI